MLHPCNKSICSVAIKKEGPGSRTATHRSHPVSGGVKTQAGAVHRGSVEEQRLQQRRQSAVLLGAQTEDSKGGRTQAVGGGGRVSQHLRRSSPGSRGPSRSGWPQGTVAGSRSPWWQTSAPPDNFHPDSHQVSQPPLLTLGKTPALS